ncbi:MAG TPA: 3-phosphoserine/phosphohydroxythreonine transaminase [Chloroflexota bacterium]|nr:3-phosphoserine/phosphohydroxythreonine transaminase [Chloroflexota bacterium]
MSEKVRTRLYNFSAGPAVMPPEVLEASARALVDYNGMGAGIAELSHRGPELDAVFDETTARVRALMDVPDEYDVLYLQGGATTLFATIPMCFLREQADYLITGEWTLKAAEAARYYGRVNVIGSSEATGFDRNPTGWHPTPGADYLYVCSNETISGTRWSELPSHPSLIVDASSELMARPFDVRRLALLFGGAQKNLGPTGLVLAIVRRDLYERIPSTVPAIFDFRAQAKAGSRLNTPPTFAVYMLLETLRWLEREGGIPEIERRNEQKAALIYEALDELSDFYTPTVTDKPNRSRMNVTFRLPTEALTNQFLQESEARGMIGLKGYRTVGGIRASIYNAMPIEGCAALAELMRDFAETKLSVVSSRKQRPVL